MVIKNKNIVKVSEIFDKLLIILSISSTIYLIKMIQIKKRLFSCEDIEVGISMFHVFVGVPDNYQDRSFSFSSNICFA